MKIAMRKADMTDGVRFYIHDGRNIVNKFNWTKIKEFEPVPDTGFLKHEEAQALIDDLWDCGLRPSEGTGSAGAMAATQNHLKDLQKLVFKGKC